MNDEVIDRQISNDMVVFDNDEQNGANAVVSVNSILDAMKNGSATNETFVELWCDDYTVGFAVINDCGFVSMSTDEWRSYDSGIADRMMLIYEEAKYIYNMPGRIDFEKDYSTLFSDIMASFHQYVDLPPRDGKTTGDDSPYEACLASWCVASGFSELTSVRPRLYITAQTKTGKTRLIKMLSLNSYHGFTVGNPTQSIMYRATDRHSVTLCMDEVQDLDKDANVGVMNIVKLGFDGSPIVRTRMDGSGELEVFKNKAFTALAIKDWTPAEDVMNRGIPIIMANKTRPIDGDEPTDCPMFRDIRSRITLLSLMVNGGYLDYEGARAKAKAVLMKPYPYRSKEYVLDSRERSIAEVLLTPVFLLGADERYVDDIMEVMLRSKITADESIRDTYACQAWYALYEECINKGLTVDSSGKPIIPYTSFFILAKDVRSTMAVTLKENGEIKDEKDVRTKNVTAALKTLKFEFHEGHAREKRLTLDSSFEMAWKNCIARYGVPETESKEGDKKAEGIRSLGDVWGRR